MVAAYVLEEPSFSASGWRTFAALGSLKRSRPIAVTEMMKELLPIRRQAKLGLIRETMDLDG